MLIFQNYTTTTKHAAILPAYRKNLARSGNSKIPDRLAFSRHMKPVF